MRRLKRAKPEEVSIFKGVQIPRAAIFDIDGTLVDSVDLHARPWYEALVKFGHQVTFEQARSQIGKGGDQLIPIFLSEAEQKDHGEEMEEWHIEGRFATPGRVTPRIVEPCGVHLPQTGYDAAR